MVTIIQKGTSKEKIQSILAQRNKRRGRKGVDVMKYCGLIQLKEDPVSLQKRWRDEWE
jgi:hypothetical protein